ncbi:hypothetical protein TRIATDRAFT_302720 [Trichoderma atroviride IMI 206040]|uniref:Uncharacterized protein n=1 Tax=Hypocrea atroviridis (strain ATCC 20476 / IMI 206040) TaxID=452589 RepID=G9P9M2_HYPAI|nr:uncharacterized protein TRIATDRAFT_302720 [Trichoderma atroviride IMI 206040]EHK40344.1 hypothetical protein TRIATDRAFT_302720 [Trichoderma atroviride IMI 206040]
MAKGRCVQPGCQGFGLAACMYHHMLCAGRVAVRESEEARKKNAAYSCYIIMKEID